MAEEWKAIFEGNLNMLCLFALKVLPVAEKLHKQNYLLICMWSKMVYRI